MRNLMRLTALAGATAGTLAVAGGVAFATAAPTLSGSYSVTVTRTVSQGLTNQPVGQSGVEPWKVVTVCTSPTDPTTCTTTLEWTGLSGKQYEYKTVLTHTKKMQYTGTHTFTQTCRGHKGAHIPAGWSVSQTTNVVGSHATAGRIDRFNATISTTYTPTSAGTAGGCIAAKEVLTGAGTAV